jgi:hypothetical protein
MENYLFVYYGGKMAATPAEQKKSMDEWMNWFKNQGAQQCRANWSLKKA